MSNLLSKGFTLIEITIVLFIIGLMIAGLLGPLETQLEARDRAATIETMDQIIEALYGYAITNGRLPCPDNNGDGVEDAAACGGTGFLPWVDLATPQGDAWGNRFSYRATSPRFTTVDGDGVCNGDTAGHFDLCASGDIDIQTRGDDAATNPAVEAKATPNLATNVPAIVISHGRNGFGATSTAGLLRPVPPATNIDELENTNAGSVFMSRIFAKENAGCDDADETLSFCEYDDLVKWLSPALLNNRMVVAGQLP